MENENIDQMTPEDKLNQFKELMTLVRDEWKIRRAREFLLMTICTIVLLYTYPIAISADGSDKIKEVIEISPLSIKIPLSNAIAIFPTIIAVIYLVYLSSSSKVNAFTALAFGSLGRKRTYIEDRMYRAAIIFIPAAVTPADVDKPVALSALGQVTQIIIILFVGLIFSVFPYAMIVLSTFQSWQLFESGILFSWNLMCVAIMILAVVGQIFSASKERGVIY